MNQNNNTYLRYAYYAVFSYSIIIGFSFLFLKTALKFGNPLYLLSHRFLLSFLFLCLINKLGIIKINLQKKDYIKILPLSLFYPLLFFAFQQFSLIYITSSLGGIILATSPIFTMILASIFLKEKSTIIQKFSICLSVIGVIYISIKSGISLGSGLEFGIFLMLIATIALSIYNILLKKYLNQYDIISIVFAIALSAFLSFAIIALVEIFKSGDFKNYFLPFTNKYYLFSILYLGILSTSLTSILTTFSLSRIKASQVSVFSNLSTLITILAGIIFLHENFYYFHIIGSILIILGVIGANIGKKK
ncbi:DMT family transporter [Peptostreptococcus equinus]|uniref:DMT family transporter n=1 Tax=Peptostreptococcus equinus TaxID=3003601 RepID=A0ABY7JM57_9FIRM|nr:DMT family transporter [Peptostreptococcus sp. CBA3647]WAW14441.1 DMT family transporter [Peptostreptococcus sp. CBA3647]